MAIRNDFAPGEVLAAADLNDTFGSKAAYPSGGVDGNALIKSGTSTAWGSAGGLVFLTGADFTTATSFSLPNSTFTSTYRNYKVIIQVTALTADSDFTVRLRTSGSDISTSNYDNMLVGIDNAGNASNAASLSASSFNFGESDDGAVWHAAEIDLIGPNLNTQTMLFTRYTFVNKAATVAISRQGAQTFRLTTQVDSMSFISSVASSMTGAYRVYGYVNS
jgi:hypothetical protein